MATLTENRSGSEASSVSWPESARAWMFELLFSNLCGVTFTDWCRILKENRFSVSPRYWHRAAILTVGSTLNSLYRRREDRIFGERLASVTVPPPLFILGHWRSGTTLLHQLLSLDQQFAYPNLYEVFFPHTFLCTEDLRTSMVAPLIPRKRVFDNVPQGFDLPNEDEFATAAASLCSPYLLWAFPRNVAHYERFLTFREASQAEIGRWKAGLLLFLKKLTLRYDRPLLLKSPPHTGRVKLLLELFPDARFVHVHRDPYTIFRSTRHLNDVLTRSMQLQLPDLADRDEAVIRRYRAIHDAYFDDRALIPKGRLHEIAFEDLERDPVGQIRDTYRVLGLPGFDNMLPRLEEHVDSHADYRKNAYDELPIDLKLRIRNEWRRSFDEWGYSLD